MENLPTQVESIVAEFLDCGVSSFEIPAGGRIAETYILELDDEPWHAVCKIGGPSVRTGDVIEPLAIRLVDSITDLPVPHVFASGVFTGVSGPNKYWALYEFCDGSQPVPFDSLAVSDRHQIVSEIGTMLRTLHSVDQFERVGGLCRNNDSLYICDPNGLNFPKQGRRVAQLLPVSTNEQWEPVLSHGDLFPDNLLVDEEGSITALLDWGECAYHDCWVCIVTGRNAVY